MKENKRILVIDDDEGVRETYQRILSPVDRPDLLSQGRELFDFDSNELEATSQTKYELSLACNGTEGINLVAESVGLNKPFAVAFIDMKMPGIDGAHTSKKIWNLDPDIRIVIVTAFSDYTPERIISIVGRVDIFYLRKPFNREEIVQFARVLVNEWHLEHQHRSLEQQLKDANLKLEFMNRDLREEVQKQAALIVQSEKMAAIGLLVAGVAHEINNPIAYVNGNLMVIKGYFERIIDLFDLYTGLGEMILKRNDPSLRATILEIQEFRKEKKIDKIVSDLMDLADESMEGTERVKKIVQDLRMCSRMEDVDCDYGDINAILDSTLSILHNELKNKVSLVKDYGTLPEIKCFRSKLGQVFMNLIMNACQSIESKGSIRISTALVREGKRATDSHVLIRITDTGCGIPRENISQLFDPFFTTKPVGLGTGLGLSITYEIIKAHGGHIEVSSQEGEGTSFSILLPA